MNQLPEVHKTLDIPRRFAAKTVAESAAEFTSRVPGFSVGKCAESRALCSDPLSFSFHKPSLGFHSDSKKRTLRFALAIFCALVAAPLFFIPQSAFAQHAGGGHVGGGHFGGGGGHAVPPPSTPAPAQHYIPVQAPRPIVAPPHGAQGSPAGNGFIQRPGGTPSYVGPGAPVIGNHVQMPPTPPSAPQHVTIGFPPNPFQHGYTVGAPQHLAGTSVSGTVRFEGQGHDIWAASLNGTPLLARPAQPNTPAGWSVNAERNASSGWRPRGRPIQGPIVGRGFFGPGFGIVGISPFFGFGGFGFGYGLGWADTCGPYFSWGFGCNALPYYGAGYGYGADDYGYFLNAAPYEPSNWPNDESLQNQGQPEENPPVSFSYQAPTTEEEQNNLRADQTETVIFLKDGGVDLVNDYWVAGGTLHYANGGGENIIPLDQIDIQKTVDVNASRGLTFTLRPSPNDSQNAPSQQSPSAAPNSAPSAAPAAPPAPPAPPQ